MLDLSKLSSWLSSTNQNFSENILFKNLKFHLIRLFRTYFLHLLFIFSSRIPLFHQRLIRNVNNPTKSTNQIADPFNELFALFAAKFPSNPMQPPFMRLKQLLYQPLMQKIISPLSLRSSEKSLRFLTHNVIN